MRMKLAYEKILWRYTLVLRIFSQYIKYCLVVIYIYECITVRERSNIQKREVTLYCLSVIDDSSGFS
jgi:hypothetical protein